MLAKDYENASITIQRRGRHAIERKTRSIRVNLTAVIATCAFIANTLNNAVNCEISKSSEKSVESKTKIVASSAIYGENEDQYNDLVGAEILRQMEEEERAVANAEATENAEAEGISEEENSLNFTNQVASADLQLLSMVTYAEAGNQTLEQQIAVAATILNRVESESFPNTIQEVISQKGQFSSVKGGTVMAFGKPVDFSEVPESCVEAAERALAGEDPTEELLRQEAISKGFNPDEYASGGALFFYNPDYCGSSEIEMRNGIQVKVEYGDHIFYKVW